MGVVLSRLSGIEGQLDLAQLLGSLLMTPNAPLDLLAVPGSFVNVEQDGLSLGLIAGFRSPRTGAYHRSTYHDRRTGAQRS